ncbi:nucleoside diphosphate kinase regulator [Geobacter pelophilus]|uniref:Nucleoside diphosphate kinase regulator n=1 Tax=Geoanaerobacter pelophilus TaxID=60036 RepID=A0AAW4KYG8_9BACT|nr:nucleoside diphosphate kinase regulator [Geoanaerobacter pelophilus]MBT0663676.1 nucleoside diphosphate kinase regulator [Geoanaerobacter pelophilus]
MDARTIYITEYDVSRLEDLLELAKEFNYRDREDLKKLEEELSVAKIVDSQEIPPNIVTMNSKFRLRDLNTDKEMVLTLVFPKDANVEEGKISAVSPIGTATLGYSVGDTIEWNIRSAAKKFKIEEILYQPEAAGDFHL